MTKVTNLSTEQQVIMVKGDTVRKRVQPKAVSLEPGADGDFDLFDRKSPHNLGREHAGVLEFGGAAVDVAASVKVPAKGLDKKAS